jgi:hypothetical protein
VLSFKLAEPRARTSLQNWVDGTGCLVREETEYLDYSEELIELGAASDNATAKLEAWVEDNLIRFYKGFRQVCIGVLILREQAKGMIAAVLRCFD